MSYYDPCFFRSLSVLNWPCSEWNPALRRALRANEESHLVWRITASGADTISIEQTIITYLHRLPLVFAFLLKEVEHIALAIHARAICMLTQVEGSPAWIHGVGEHKMPIKAFVTRGMALDYGRAVANCAKINQFLFLLRTIESTLIYEIFAKPRCFDRVTARRQCYLYTSLSSPFNFSHSALDSRLNAEPP